MTDAEKLQLMHRVVDRFLQWKLPENFNPDNGISFDPIINKGHMFESRREPVGTNLLDYTQALNMVEAILGDELDNLVPK